MKEDEYIDFNSVIISGLVLIVIFFTFLSYAFSGYDAHCICYGEKFDVYHQSNFNISQVCRNVCTNENITGQHYYLKDAKCEYNEQVIFGTTAVWGCGL